MVDTEVLRERGPRVGETELPAKEPRGRRHDPALLCEEV